MDSIKGRLTREGGLFKMITGSRIILQTACFGLAVTAVLICIVSIGAAQEIEDQDDAALVSSEQEAGTEKKKVDPEQGVQIEVIKKKQVDRWETVETKKLIGKLLSLSPRGDPRFIGITPETGNTDYNFHIDEAVKIEFKDSLQEFAIGDTVQVTYDETSKIKYGVPSQSKRVVKVIRFLKPAATGLRTE